MSIINPMPFNTTSSLLIQSLSKKKEWKEWGGAYSTHTPEAVYHAHEKAVQQGKRVRLTCSGTGLVKVI